MKNTYTGNFRTYSFWFRLAAPLCCMIALACVGAPPKKGKPEPAEKNASKPATPASDPLAIVKIDQSTFPKSAFNPVGANPFFPNSSQLVKPAAIVAKQQAEPSLVLNGITGPPLRSAMINGRTFLQGEEGDVRIDSSTKVSIKCAEIMDESAVVEVNGQRKTLKLRLGI